MLQLGILLLPLLYSVHLMANEPPELIWCLDDHWHTPAHEHKLENKTALFMQTIAERLAITIRPTPLTPFSRCLRKMELGQADLMVSLNYSVDRERFLHLIPYDEAQPESLYLLRTADDIASWDAIKQRNIVMLHDYGYNPELQQMLSKDSFRLIQAASLEDAFAMLLLQEADVVIGPAQSAVNVIHNNPRLHNQFKQASYQFNFRQARTINLAFSRASSHQELLPKLQQLIQQMIENDEIKQFRQQTKALD